VSTVTESHTVPLAPDAPAPARPALVLVADDQEWSARALESVLAPAGFAVLRCTSGRQLLEQARLVVPDLLLVKADLDAGGAAALLGRLRAEGRLAAGTPVFVTAAAPLQRAERLAVLAAGAWDVFHLPLDSEELVLRLGTVARAKFEADRVREESLLDPDTGLYSVQGLLRRVREMGYQALRRPAPLACAVLAPEAAWAGGEAVEPDERQIAELARHVAHVARRSDVVGRVSRSEFAVLAPGTGSAEVMLLARRLVVGAEAEGALRVRVGCCAIDDPEEAGLDPVELLVRATMALRRAQRDPAASAVCLYDDGVPMG
jgi:PleD family two-component response regulator